MEYIRKQRWANYLSPKCKEYLRNDFSHECAYCKLQEQEVGIVGLDFFEICLTHINIIIYIILAKSVITRKVIFGIQNYSTLVLMISFLGLTLQLQEEKKRIIINILPKTIEEHFILIPLNLIPEHKSVSGKQEKIMKTAYTRLIL